MENGSVGRPGLEDDQLAGLASTEGGHAGGGEESEYPCGIFGVGVRLGHESLRSSSRACDGNGAPASAEGPAERMSIDAVPVGDEAQDARRQLLDGTRGAVSEHAPGQQAEPD